MVELNSCFDISFRAELSRAEERPTQLVRISEHKITGYVDFMLTVVMLLVFISKVSTSEHRFQILLQTARMC